MERPEGSLDLPPVAQGLPCSGRLALCDWDKSMGMANQLVEVPGSLMYKPSSVPPKPSSSYDLEDLFDSPAPQLRESLQSIMAAAKEQLDDLEATGELNRSPKKRKRNRVPYHMAADVGKLMGSEAFCCKSYIYY